MVTRAGVFPGSGAELLDGDELVTRDVVPDRNGEGPAFAQRGATRLGGPHGEETRRALDGGRDPPLIPAAD